MTLTGRLWPLVALICWAEPLCAEVEYLGTHVWTRPEAAFGGLSGFDLLPDGSGFLAVADRGLLYAGRIERSTRGIAGIDATVVPLSSSNGAPLGGRDTDAEGVALAQDGRIFVSYEGGARVWEHGPDGRLIQALPIPSAFRAMQRNSALEALAVDDAGRLYTLPERSGRYDRPFPVFRWTGETWDRPFDIPRRGKFMPVGADIGPDGLFYLLERDFNGLTFPIRIRRFALDGTGEEVLLETMGHDNLEGIAVWEDTAGLRMTLISDDNFRRLQRTLIVDYRLTQGG